VAESGKGRLVGLAYPHDRFEHGIKGVEPITRDGVHVPANYLKKLQQLADDHGVPLVHGDEVEEQTASPEGEG
jgi:hypothetical protein